MLGEAAAPSLFAAVYQGSSCATLTLFVAMRGKIKDVFRVLIPLVVRSSPRLKNRSSCEGHVYVYECMCVCVCDTWFTYVIEHARSNVKHMRMALSLNAEETTATFE